MEKKGGNAIFQIPYGTHTLILAILYCLLLFLLLKLNIMHCLGITAFGFSLIMLGGGLCGLVVMWSGYSMEYLIEHIWLHIMFGHLENLFLLLYLSRIYL